MKATSGNTTPTATHQLPPQIVIIPNSSQKVSGSSFLSSSVNLSAWDGLIDDYFGDVLIDDYFGDVPMFQKTATDLNFDLSVTCDCKNPNPETEEFSVPTVDAETSRLLETSTSGLTVEPFFAG